MQQNPTRFRGWIVDVGKPELIFLGLMTVGHLLVHWYTNMLPLALPFIKKDLGLTDVQVATIVAIQLGVSSAFTVVSGILADSLRRRSADIVSCAIFSFGLALFVIGISRSYLYTSVGAATIGLGTALWHPTVIRALSLKFPDKRGMALSVHGMGASIGDSIGPLIVGAIIAGAIKVVVDWKLALELHLIPSIVIALLLWRGLGKLQEIGNEKQLLTPILLVLNQYLLIVKHWR